MTVLRLAAMILVVGTAQNLAGQLWSPLGRIDALMILVVLQALHRSFEPAIFLGAGAGLVQDGLTGGLLGLHAFSKTAVAAALASVGRVVVIRGAVTESMAAGVATVGGGLVERALLRFLDWPGSDTLGAIALRGALTALAALAFLSIGPWVLMRWRRWRRRPSSPW